ncbi:MAG: hypothetical protein NC397_02850 [Clostridium sp.]|nr:hypothetical protein [Clostridium sp.]
MKKFFSLALCFIFIFLCSCSVLPGIAETADITLEQLENKAIQSISINDKYMLILACDYEECGGKAYEGYDENQTIKYYFYLWNIHLGKLKYEFASDSENIYDIADIKLTDDNRIILYPFEENMKSKVYDLKFNEIGTTDDTLESITDNELMQADSNELIDKSKYTICDNAAYYTNYIDKMVTVFLDDSSSFYISKFDSNNNIIKCIDKRVYSLSNEQNKNIQYSYIDYADNICKSIDLKYDFEYYPAQLAVGNTYSAVTLVDDNNQPKVITIINNSAMEEAPADTIEKININDANDKITSIENEIKSLYGVEVEAYKKYDADSHISFYQYNNDSPKSELIMTLLDLKHCLSTFPKELYEEIKKNKDNSTRFDIFKLYIIGSFDNEANDTDVSAYCDNYGDDEKFELYIVYSVSDFNIANFYHEFMHALEYRINDYVPEFEEEWSELNPDGFAYTYSDDYGEFYYDNEDYQDFFTRSYGTKNSLEDRATIFETICSSAFHNEIEPKPYWLEREPIYKKVKYLYSILEESFTSLSDNSFYVWNMYDKFLK